ncbi:MAG: hypothetical protein J5501_06110 [Ruminococcus sp.]|nr:hypothetical protein [Ruminococcus sp.]
MTTMTAETMIQANGGKYRYQCLQCDSKARTKIAMLMHVITNHLGGRFKKI